MDIIKKCVKKNKFTIALNVNRQENIDFIAEYNLNTYRQKTIILSIKTTDFCYSVKNFKAGFGNEVLYIFCPQRLLYNIFGKRVKVDIYLKFNIIKDIDDGGVVVVSFHKRNKPISYLFR